MAAQERKATGDSEFVVTEAEVDAVIYEAQGDHREAIRMLLHDIATLARDAEDAASRGYIRGRFAAGARRPRDRR